MLAKSAPPQTKMAAPKKQQTQLTDRLLASQTKMLTKNSTIDLKNGTQIRKKQTPQSSSSYTYHTYNPNRLSSYDNDIYEYNTNQQRQTDLETIFKKTQMSNNQRASIAVPNTKQSNIHLLKSCVNSSNVSSSSNKTNSSSNLFTRAFNYAFKKNDSTTKLSWKSKLGKFFPQSTSNRKLNLNNKEEGCHTNMFLDNS